MSIEPKDILATAKRLHDGGSTAEADLRSAASRAYYAALHASHLALPTDLTPKAGDLRAKGSHQAVIDAIELWAKAARPGRMEARVLVHNLCQLRAIRKKADYNLTGDFLIKESLDALQYASTVFSEIAHANKKLGLMPNE